MISVATESDRALPKGWRWVKLGEVCENVQSGFASGQRDPEGVIQLRMNNLDTRGNFVWDDFIRVPASHQAVAQFRLELNDVLFNNTNSKELVGKSALFTGHAEDVVFSNHFTRIRTCPDALSPSFLAAWLNQQWLMGVFASICNSWIGQSAVKPTKLLSLEIPLPPLPEQKRIAAILNEQMAAVERARKAAAARITAVNSLADAYLNRIFSRDKIALWPKRPLGEVASITASIVDPTLPEFRDLPHVNGENIESGTCRLLAVRSAAEDNMTSGKYLFPPGCVLYSKLRPYLRKVAIADLRGLCSADMYPIEVDPQSLNPRFTAWMLLSSYFTDYAVGESQRARMPKLNRDQLFAWVAPVPLLREQETIAAKLSEQLVGTSTLRAELGLQNDGIDALPASLLRRAFAGEV